MLPHTLQYRTLLQFSHRTVIPQPSCPTGTIFSAVCCMAIIASIASFLIRDLFSLCMYVYVHMYVSVTLRNVAVTSCGNVASMMRIRRASS